MFKMNFFLTFFTLPPMINEELRNLCPFCWETCSRSGAASIMWPRYAINGDESLLCVHQILSGHFFPLSLHSFYFFWVCFFISRVYVGMWCGFELTQCENLPKKDPVRPHVAQGRIQVMEDAFWGHPFQRQEGLEERMFWSKVLIGLFKCGYLALSLGQHSRCLLRCSWSRAWCLWPGQSRRSSQVCPHRSTHFWPRGHDGHTVEELFPHMTFSMLILNIEGGVVTYRAPPVALKKHCMLHLTLR